MDTRHAALPVDAAAIFQALRVPVVVIDRDLLIVHANPSYLEMYGFDWETIRGRQVFDIFPESEVRIATVKARFDRVFSGEAIVTEAQRYRVGAGDAAAQDQVWRTTESPVFGPDGRVTHLVMAIEDVSEQVALRHQRAVVYAELEHRLRNTLAMISAMAMLTGQNAENVDYFVEAFTARIEAMGRNLKLVSENHWQGLSMRAIVEDEISQVISPSDPRVTLEGPDVTLSERSTKWTALLVHEMVSNAVRYGCFAVPDGRLSVVWRLENDQFISEWTETGRRHDMPENRKGFGTTMLNLMPNVVSRRELRPEGLYLRIESPAHFIRPELEAGSILAGT